MLFLGSLTAAGVLQWLRPVEIAAYPFFVGLVAAGAFVASAAVIGGWAIREMRRCETPLEPRSRPRHLVTGGPFRFTRNPLYVSQLLVVTGIALAVNSVWFLAAAAVLFVLLDRLVVVREESVLRETFGSEYASYTTAVRRWL